MNFDQDKVNFYRNQTVYKLLKGKEPEPGFKIDGKKFLPLLDSEIKKVENRWKDHKDEVEILAPKKTKESPNSSKIGNRSK